MGDLVDLAPDLAGGLEHDDVQRDVEALDRGAHARGARSDHDHIVECFDTHGLNTTMAMVRSSRFRRPE
ncbi:MAG: hypothetical protein ACYCV7_13795 [Acidimicrobiales bacterium]